MLAKVIVFSIFIVFSMLLEGVLAKVPPKKIEAMISDADAIVIGRVVSIDYKPTSKDILIRCDERVYSITIQVKKLITGKINKMDKLTINSRFVISIEPIFSMGDLSILFLKQEENGVFTVVNGYLGKLDIEESAQMLKYNPISGQPERESVQSFLKKIRLFVGSGGADISR